MNRIDRLRTFYAGFVLAVAVLGGCVCQTVGLAPESATGVALDQEASNLTQSANILPISSNLQPGAYGKVIYERALFQGCEIVDGADFCAFHANGWKYYAYRGGPTADAALDPLESLPINTPVIIAGDAIVFGDITVELALREVTTDPKGDPYADLRASLQGRWQSVDDPLSEIEIMGSEIRDVYNGQFLGLDYLRIVNQCDDAPPNAGPLLLRSTPEDHEATPLCYGISIVDSNTLELVYMGRGNTLSYRRLVFRQP